jgi:hypothetical protein
MDFLGKCGVISPRILSKLNDLRNSIEHDYVPNKEEVEDFIDITSLFISSMKVYHDRYPIGVGLFNATDDSGQFDILSIGTPLDEGVLKLNIRPVGGSINKKIYQDISVNQEEYFVWIRYILNNSR